MLYRTDKETGTRLSVCHDGLFQIALIALV